MNEEQQNPMHELDELEAPTLRMKDHEYQPSTLKVKEGAVIKLINDDQDEHSITAQNGEFDIEIEGGNQEEMIPPVPGTYDFYCKYHPEMNGTLIVES